MQYEHQVNNTIRILLWFSNKNYQTKMIPFVGPFRIVCSAHFYRFEF